MAIPEVAQRWFVDGTSAPKTRLTSIYHCQEGHKKDNRTLFFLLKKSRKFSYQWFMNLFNIFIRECRFGFKATHI
jgi:hypothetical protein